MNQFQLPEDIEFEDKSDDEEAPSPEIPKEVRKLRTQAYDKSVIDLIRMIREDELLLDPDYQRNYIWNNKKASLLIESILLNVPIPVIYVSEDEDNRWSVVDGLQRLYSLYRFFSNEFRLTRLEVLTELEGLTYTKLNPKAARILNNGILRIIVILQESHPEIKYDIFQRLNQSPIRLAEQELRNCVYRGEFINMLKALRNNPKFLSCMGLKVPQKRFLDAELILRYFALADAFDFETGKVKGYFSKMKTFLNAYIGKYQSAPPEEITRFKKRFENTIDKVHFVFGERAFRRVVDTEGNKDALLNRALMDVIMVSFDRFPLDGIQRNKNAILKLYAELPNSDRRFADSISYRTSDNKELEYRLSTWLHEMARLIS
jgi:hypothetical protein